MPELEKLPIFYKAYSRAYLTDLEVFQNTILNQPIWGNRFKKSVLLLRNWIRSGIRYVNDLIFVDGVLDISVCDSIIEKKTILIEYLCVRSALLPFVNSIVLAQNNDARIMYKPKVIKEKSKFYYKNFSNGKLLSVDIMSHFLQPYCIRNQIDEKELFERRVCYEQEKKLKELSFKMLYGILPCGVNLKKWKIRQTSLCDVCKEEQTITHLFIRMSVCSRIVEL